VSREDVVTALLAAADRLGPVSLRLRTVAQKESADELDELAADLARAARGQLPPMVTAARVVDALRQRSIFLRVRAQYAAAGTITAILRDLASVADAELEDTQVGIPVDDSDTFVIDEPESG
jgi:hypothetical protein